MSTPDPRETTEAVECCAACGASGRTCMESDGGCCAACRATAGCSHDTPAPDHGAERDTLAVALEELADLCPHEPDEHPEGCCEVCDYAAAATVVLQEHDERLRAVLAADQPTAPVPGPTRAAEGLRAVLADLVRLKDGPRNDAYRAEKEAAWDRARAALEATEGEREAGAAGLTDEQKDDFRRQLRQNLGYRAFVIEDTMVSHVERILAARSGGALTPRVHDHPPYRPPCNERDVDGQLRGACLNDNGTPHSSVVLTDEDRQALADWWDSEWPRDGRDALDTLADAVVEIVARRTR